MRPTTGRRLTELRQAWHRLREVPMADLAYLLLIVAFFAATAWLVRGVDRL